MATMYFDDTNKITLPSDGGYLKARGDKLSDDYINAQSSASTPKFTFGGKTETCDVKFCTANANKTIDMQNGYMWFYLQHHCKIHSREGIPCADRGTGHARS